MKSKFLSTLLAAALILQSVIAAPVFASSQSKINVDFSASNASYDVSETIDNVFDYQIVKGQYGKSADDASIRLYSLGGTTDGLDKTKQLTIDTSSVAAASDGQYTHMSVQLLNEDGYSSIEVNVDYVASDGTTQSGKKVLYQPRDASNSQHTRVLYKSTTTNGGVNRRYNKAYGIWSQLDVYFDSGSNEITTFFDGVKVKNAAPNWAEQSSAPAKEIVKQLTAVKLRQVIRSQSPYKATGVQFDNVVVETVNSVPETLSYRLPGEGFDFDDDMTIGEDNAYKTVYWYNETDGYKAVKRNISVSFKSTTANTIASGKFGKQSWDNSLHTLISDSAAEGQYAMYYTPGVKDFTSGDYVHLTFAMANGSPSKSADVASDNTDLFEMSSDGNFKFFGIDTGDEWEKEKWYKVDIIFKVGTDTKADCYIDGVKYLSNYVWSDDAISTLGTLAFSDAVGADYYVDDVAVGLFDSSSCIDPSDGWQISTDDPDLGEAIDNDARVITVAGTYKAEDFLSKIKNPETVTLYNSNGAIVYSGLLTSCAIKVSNTFGAGVWYSIETTGTVTEASLFDIADGSSVIAANVDTLNIDASNEESMVIKTDIYIDGGLYDSVDGDAASVDLSPLMLGKHTFEAYAYINDKDCYMDSVTLALVEEKKNVILATNTFDDYTAGSSTMTGGKIVQQGARTRTATVTDNYGKNYGTSVILEGTKNLYTANGNAQNLYMDISTPVDSMITKAVLEFDICYLSDGFTASTTYRGKSDLASTDITAASVTTGKLGTSTSYYEETRTLETNRWYHIKSMMDVKNGLTSLWIDGVALIENEPVSTQVVQIASEIRIKFGLPTGAYDSADTFMFAAMDNISLVEYDELAYVDSVEDSNGDSPVAYTEDTLTIKMSTPVEVIDAEGMKLYSTNGERAVESVTIDENDASILYVTPKYKLSSADTYNLVIDAGMKSAGAFSTKANCGFFKTTAKAVDVLSGGFTLDGSTLSFDTKLTNTSNADKDLVIIAYVYEGTEFKGIAAKTVTVKAGRNLTDSIDLPYYSPTAKINALVTDDWSTLKPITNKLYSYGF